MHNCCEACGENNKAYETIETNRRALVGRSGVPSGSEVMRDREYSESNEVRGHGS